MARPKIDYGRRIGEIPQHTSEMPDEADVPILHYERSANDAWNLLLYVDRNLRRAKTYGRPLEQHLHRLFGMVLLNLVEAFERYLKELAAACVDQVGSLVLDDRLDVLNVKGNAFAAHFESGSLGRSLCESSTWLDCDEINRRFRRILADPFDDGKFFVFPKHNQGPEALRGHLRDMQIVFQLRHAIVHNAAVLTKTDARKLQLLTRRKVDAPRVLRPSRADVWYVKLLRDFSLNPTA